MSLHDPIKIPSHTNQGPTVLDLNCNAPKIDAIRNIDSTSNVVSNQTIVLFKPPTIRHFLSINNQRLYQALHVEAITLEYFPVKRAQKE